MTESMHKFEIELSERLGLNRHANASVRISVSTSSTTDHRDSGRVVLRIEDAVSGMVLALVEMPPDRFWSLLQGGVQTWPGFISRNLDRIGKKQLVQRVSLGRGPGDKAGADAAARLCPEFETCDEYEVRASNMGWEAIFRSWGDSDGD